MSIIATIAVTIIATSAAWMALFVYQAVRHGKKIDQLQGQVKSLGDKVAAKVNNG